jgi:YVTN family beta-propeller protein
MSNRCGTLNRRKGHAKQAERLGVVLVLGTVSIGGLWSAGRSVDRQLASIGDGAAGRVPDPLEPIAITRDNAQVWSVNPDSDSVSVFDVAGDHNVRIDQVPVGKEPWCVAITPDSAKVYVTNMVSGTVSVINRSARVVVKTIKVGTEPFGCALSPDGSKLYVTNQSSDDVSLINTSTDAVIKTIRPVGPKPRGIAVSADGTKVYVTQFLSQSPADDESRPLTQTEGSDTGRVGRVTVIDGVGNRPIRVIPLKSFDVAAFFKSDGDTLGRIPLSGAGFNTTTKAFPNLLERRRHPGESRVCRRDLRLSERPVPLQRQRPELRDHDRYDAGRGDQDRQHERWGQLRGAG